MKFYFLSSRPSILKIGGAYFGTVGTFEKFAEITPEDNLFAEFIPQNALPVGFFINDELRFHPPLGVEVYFLKNGVCIFVKDYPPADQTFSLIAQKRFSSLLVSVFRSGNIQAVFSFENQETVCPLEEEFSLSNVFLHENLVYIEGQNVLAVFTKNGNLLFKERFTEYRLFDGGMTVTTPLSDGLQTQIQQRFTLHENAVHRQEYTVLSRKEFQQELYEKTIPYLFFQSVLLSLDFERFLSDSLKEKTQNIHEFLGEFVAVAFSDTEKEIALVRKKRERVFELSYYQVEMKDGKIVDIKG
ncbi:MAG: hypothetical protein IIX01_03140 [Clostridia bacterium]|nr:hypothetical protein [Clostridia bacterium]